MMSNFLHGKNLHRLMLLQIWCKIKKWLVIGASTLYGTEPTIRKSSWDTRIVDEQEGTSQCRCRGPTYQPDAFKHCTQKSNNSNGLRLPPVNTRHSGALGPIVVSFPNGTPLWQEEWCMNENIVINSMRRLPKKSDGVTQRSFFLAYASVYVAAFGATIVCDWRAVAENEQIVQWVILPKQLCGLLKRVG